ncbi:MAG: putative addiction module antidote protein [Rhodospirillaceae bacterium]|nr:putative addiction module antidote protein [Rhodospirillaceae bacterium]
MSTKIELRPFDMARYLDDEEMVSLYLSEALASGDAAEISEALGTVARARGMAKIAKRAGVSRENLYRSLSRAGDPQLSTLLRVLAACDITLTAKPAPIRAGLTASASRAPRKSGKRPPASHAHSSQK